MPMWRRYFHGSSVLLLACHWVTFSPAAPIGGIFSTGVDDQGNPLPSNTVDPHYTLIAAPGPRSAVPLAYTLMGGHPVPPWLAEGPTSRWIAPEANQALGSAP